MPRWALIVCILLVLWGLMGVLSFYNQMTMTPEAAAAMPKAEVDMWNSMPKWLWVDFAIAVLAGLAGAVALLLRKAWAVPLTLVSLIAVVLQFGYIFAFMPVISTLGPSAAMFPAAIVIVAFVAWWLAQNWKAKGWLT
jgi:hypothetical protein